jgi:hypothetical protein
MATPLRILIAGGCSSGKSALRRRITNYCEDADGRLAYLYTDSEGDVELVPFTIETREIIRVFPTGIAPGELDAPRRRGETMAAANAAFRVKRTDSYDRFEEEIANNSYDATILTFRPSVVKDEQLALYAAHALETRASGPYAPSGHQPARPSGSKRRIRSALPCATMNDRYTYSYDRYLEARWVTSARCDESAKLVRSIMNVIVGEARRRYTADAGEEWVVVHGGERDDEMISVADDVSRSPITDDGRSLLGDPFHARMQLIQLEPRGSREEIERDRERKLSAALGVDLLTLERRGWCRALHW